MTNDNCAVAMRQRKTVKFWQMCWPLCRKIGWKKESKIEKIDYQEFIRQMKCYRLGGQMVDYGVIEETILEIEETYGVT